MLFWIITYLDSYYSYFYTFRYLTVRTILASLTALTVSWLIGPKVIRILSQYQLTQPIRNEGPKTHLTKVGTPTMGGLIVLMVIFLTILLWGDLSNRYVWIVLITLIGFALIGFMDDYHKLILKNSRGLPAGSKYFWQSLLALGIACMLYVMARSPDELALVIPFFKDWRLPLGIMYILLSYCVIVGSSNAVNLTDGLDGLAIFPIVLIAGGLGVFSYVTGHAAHAQYLTISFIPGVGEMVVVCGAIAGAGLGFLWFNTYPAQIFMGDIGALSLGALLGVLSVITRQELMLFLMGGVFVAETLSVILQVLAFKLTSQRIFRMAPLHHHFELKGWPEPCIIVRFWIITLVLVLLALATLQIRTP